MGDQQPSYRPTEDASQADMTGSREDEKSVEGEGKDVRS